MILAFDFYYVSKNGVLEHLLQEIATDFGITHKVLRKDSIVTLFVEADENKLGAFADVLSVSLPLSIFFKSSSVEVVDSMPSEEQTLPALMIPLVFTPKQLSWVERADSPRYLSPSIFPSAVTMTLLEDEKPSLSVNEPKGYKSVYLRIAEFIAQGESLCVQCEEGSYVIGKLEQSQMCDAFEVIATDLSVVERMVVCKENEIKALASLERPAIRFKINALFAEKGIISVERVFLRLADSLFLYHLCKELFAQGIFFLFKTDSFTCKTTYSLVCEPMLERSVEPVSVSVLENGEILVLQGMGYASRALKESLKKFDEPSHAAFASIMQEHALFDTESSCFYLSKTHDDTIMNYSKEHGMLNLVTVSLPASFSELFTAIENSSASAKRLVENYREKFPELYEKSMQTTIPLDAPKNIYTLWQVVSIVLGMSDTFEKGAEKLIENAEDYGGEKGPRMDYYLEREDALSADFDYARLVRSGMSYKLAGTDDNTLSFGYMESLSYFISDTADAHRENLSTKKIALAGVLFGYKRLSEMVCKNLKPNHTICFNKELPIDQ
ncbi:hypothetical protein [Sulfurospirillum deleyianum]|uniref:Uncharacterized protein n=1 Tax=Sulfurospirillum deleyianum (strain ATCC 51133 / DSM 6946 / 5175) TaxID=525898 RepID=D1B206_SULD5|nr:hypothetical protein [Sulfurospirillum deleyianum]ACZ12126.1 conserved hypothetical protein [Sulfurospirillum deleyianum DSM 6946]